LNALSLEDSIPANSVFYHGRGCKKCLGTGYFGRIPIYEIMIVSVEIAGAIERNVSASRIKEIAISEGMVELSTAGLQQVISGRTTLEEVFYKISS
jgi:type IV pilus assembly protein PilB